MLSYQHIYHAGNDADCHKHSLQAALLHILRKDKAPFAYLDTHSGRGLYALQAVEMQKLREYETGIAQLWDSKPWPREAAPYQQVVDSLNRGAKMLAHYPGSPWVAEALRRTQDQLVLCELHPQEYRALQDNMGRLANVKIYREDGWRLAEAPDVIATRGLIAIDPSYELKEDYSLIAQRVETLLQRYPGFIVSIWYPVLQAERHVEMIAALAALPSPHIKSEIAFQRENGMRGSGMFILNPPDGFAAIAETLSNWLRAALGAED